MQEAHWILLCVFFCSRGHNIGIRLIDEFLSKNRMQRCTSFIDAMNMVAKQGFLMFLNIQADIKDMNKEGTECSLVCDG